MVGLPAEGAAGRRSRPRASGRRAGAAHAVGVPARAAALLGRGESTRAALPSCICSGCCQSLGLPCVLGIRVRLPSPRMLRAHGCCLRTQCDATSVGGPCAGAGPGAERAARGHAPGV